MLIHHFLCVMLSYHFILLSFSGEPEHIPGTLGVRREYTQEATAVYPRAPGSHTHIYTSGQFRVTSSHTGMFWEGGGT